MKDINISSLSTESGRLFTRNLFPYSQPFILFDVLTSKIQHRVKSSNTPAGGFPLTLRLPVYTGKLISWNTTNKISDLTTVESFDSESTRISLLLLIKFAACLNKSRRQSDDKFFTSFSVSHTKNKLLLIIFAACLNGEDLCFRLIACWASCRF